MILGSEFDRLDGAKGLRLRVAPGTSRVTSPEIFGFEPLNMFSRDPPL